MFFKIKSLIRGTAIAFIAGSLTCVAIAQDKAKIVTERSRTLSAPNGRFVLGQISDFRSDQYLLDTQTGRIWQAVEMTNEKGVSQPIFRIVLIQEADGKLSQLPN
jgi:hypothetical protein